MTKIEQEKAIKLLQDLISCASVTPQEAGSLDVIESFIKDSGFALNRQVFEGDHSYPVDNLFAQVGEGEKHLLFCGHTDVVPPGDAQSWTHDPFSATLVDGRVWGRGAVDMKSGVAAFCAAAVAFGQESGNGFGRISLAITCDEEADAVNGIDKLMQWAAERGERFDFAIVGEPSSKEKLGDSIKIGRRGSLSGQLEVKGKQGHSAYPERARNPAPVLAEIAYRLSNASFDDGSKHFQPTNLEVTALGVDNQAANVIPELGNLSFNVRFNDHWDEETLIAEIDRIVRLTPDQGCDVSWKLRSRVSNCFLSEVGDGVEVLRDAVEAKSGKRPELATFGGTSDARYIAQYCPVVECGLIGKTMHEVNENVPVADFYALCDIYLDFLRRYFQTS